MIIISFFYPSVIVLSEKPKYEQNQKQKQIKIKIKMNTSSKNKDTTISTVHIVTAKN